jgi:hypothetical protein
MWVVGPGYARDHGEGFALELFRAVQLLQQVA